MNSEAISGIKKAAALCSSIREDVLADLQLGKKFDVILEKLHNPPKTEVELLINGSHEPYDHEKIISTHISCFVDPWTDKCAGSIYLGSRSVLHDLVELNKQAVIQTGNELCPGFKMEDIDQVLELYKEDFHFTPAKHKNKSPLKAGDIISVQAFFHLCSPKDKNTPCAFHKESVLITANGAEILTRKRLSVS